MEQYALYTYGIKPKEKSQKQKEQLKSYMESTKSSKLSPKETTPDKTVKYTR